MKEEEKKAIEILRFSTLIRGRKPENDAVEILLNLIDKLQKEIDKQNKVMDEMIKWIDDRCFYSDNCGNHCEIIDAPCYDITKNWNCKDCIKQYFIRKVEEDVQ